MLAGATAEEAAEWQLITNADTRCGVDAYRYLCSGCSDRRDGVSDVAELEATRHAMRIMGIDQDVQQSIFRIVAGILRFGNVGFESLTTGEGGEGSKISQDTRGDAAAASELLGLRGADAAERALTFRKMKVRSEEYSVCLNTEKSGEARDSLCKTLYARLFRWIVGRINHQINIETAGKVEDGHFIGVLDIFGFESFDTNSFEQLCINYTNEVLQQHFNQFIFKLEQEEYIREQIKWSFIDCKFDLSNLSPLYVLTLTLTVYCCHPFLSPTLRGWF